MDTQVTDCSTLVSQLECLLLPARTRALLDGGTGSFPETEREILNVASRALRALAQALVADDEVAMNDQTLLLTGLGPGLTPTGDDILLGCAAALHRFLPERTAFRGCLLGRPPDSTTATAHRLLAAAAQGSFPEPLLHFVSLLGTSGADAARLKQAADRLAGIGAHSGCDSLAGVLGVTRLIPEATIP